MNPFRYGCVVEGENYCERPEQQRQLAELVRSGQNVVLQGPRRMGKTSLVRETVKSIRGLRLAYVDLFCVQSIADFCRRTVRAVSMCGGKSFLERTAEFVRNLRPVFTVDRETGVPQLTIDMKAASGIESIEEVLAMIARHAEKIGLCIVFDEFQDVLDIPEADVAIASLRGQVQLQGGTPFVFLGSIRNKMHEIFDSPRSPFFKSAISFDIGEIEQVRFADFLVRRFRAGNRIVSAETAKRIIELADGISGDAQELGESVWLATVDGAKVTSDDVEQGLRLLFAREQRTFIGLLKGLTAIQRNVLAGLAADRNAKPYSADFLERNSIRNVGSVTKSLKRLVDDEILFMHGGEYKFENPFLKAWLLHQAF